MFMHVLEIQILLRWTEKPWENAWPLFAFKHLWKISSMVLSSRPSPAFIVTIITINAILFLFHSLVNLFIFFPCEFICITCLWCLKIWKKIRIKRYNIYIRFQGYGGGKHLKVSPQTLVKPFARFVWQTWNLLVLNLHQGDFWGLSPAFYCLFENHAFVVFFSVEGNKPPHLSKCSTCAQIFL